MVLVKASSEGMKIIWVLYFLLSHQAPKSDASYNLDALMRLDLRVLEDKEYCEIVIDLEDYDHADFIEGSIYVSSGPNDCWPYLRISALPDLKLEACNQRYNYIKNPNETLMFFNDQQFDINEFFSADLYQALPCTLENQPYFYILTTATSDSIALVQEVQVYAKRIVTVNANSINDRRSDFAGAKIIAHTEDDNYPAMGKYNRDLAELFAKHFNFSVELIETDNYGIKLDNGSFTGTIYELQHNIIDIAMANLFFTAERLETTVQAFPSAIKTGYSIIYWKTTGSKFIYGQIFHVNLWIFLSISITILSVYLLMVWKMLKQNGKSMGQNLIQSLAINVQSCLASAPTVESNHPSIRLYLLSIGITGAFIFWCFSGLLTSYFTAESETQPISSLKDLIGNPNFRLGLITGSASSQPYYTFVQQNPDLKNALEASVVFYPTLSTLVHDMMFDPDFKDLIVIEDQISFLELAITMDRENSCHIRSATLAEAKETIRSGWIYPQNSILTPLFDDYLLNLAEHGVDTELNNKHFGFLTQLDCDDGNVQLDVDVVMILFQALAGGAGLAIFILLVECILLKYNK